MENASDALKMVAAIFIFVLAISVAMFAFTKARQAATAVLNKSNIDYYNTENIRVSNDRIVGIETIIPTLYSYFKEGYTILFYDGTAAYDINTQELREDSTIKPLTLYYSEALPSKLALSKILNKNDTLGQVTYKGVTYQRAIYGFDSNDEHNREEPWRNDDLHAKDFMKSFIRNLPVDSSETPLYPRSKQLFGGSPNKLNQEQHYLTMNFSAGNFYSTIEADSLALATNARFIERTGIYNQNAESYKDENNRINTNLSVDSSVIEFSNNETIQNNEGTQKRVIQYIYIGNK